jgi:hypothetical protein
MHTPDHCQLLNANNGLVACRVGPSIHPRLIEESLALTKNIFPKELDACHRLGQVYDTLVQNQQVVEDFEAIHYHAYAMPQGTTLKVVGIGGLYRLLELDDETAEMAPRLKTFLTRTVFGKRGIVDTELGAQELLTSLVWGGRMGMSPRISRSPHVSPFIYHHILSSALLTIELLSLPPVMLLFTRRAENHLLHRLYGNMGFVQTGAELTYLGEAQSVMALHLHKDAPIMLLLRHLTERSLRGRG